MPSIRLEVSDERLRELDAECEMLGFPDPEAYVEWLVENRAAMQGEGGRNRILSAYAKRLRDLEARLEDAAAASPEVDPDTEATAAVEEESDLRAHLAPATVRMEDDTVGQEADELERARGEGIDGILRGTVTETGGRPGDGDGSGGEAHSPPAVRSDGSRPGADVTDLEDLTVPGHDEELVERRRTAVGAALSLLQDRGEARRAEFVEELYGEVPAGYDSEAGWWGCIKRGLRQVDRVDGAGEGSRTWRYRDYRGRVTVVSE